MNGLFWPDGSVTSLRDARAIAGDDHLKLKKANPGDLRYGSSEQVGLKNAAEPAHFSAQLSFRRIVRRSHEARHINPLR
ncbi:MAG: hypothetical protein V4555_05125 [Acidobacteriota bacterium]